MIACAQYDCASTGCARLWGCPLAFQVRQDLVRGVSQQREIGVRANGSEDRKHDVSASRNYSLVSGAGLHVGKPT